jgi:hypothetical protein
MSELEQSVPFELPEHLQGLEGLIIEDAKQMGGNFNSACRASAMLIDQRIHGYWALARIATNPESLAYQLRGNPDVWDPPELFKPPNISN